LNYKITFYRKLINTVEAEDIHQAELQAQKIIQKMCSQDDDFEPASGMLHSIREQDDKTEAVPDKGLQRDFVEEAGKHLPLMPDGTIA